MCAKSQGSAAMPVKPKVFVSRVIPEAGLQKIRDNCEAEVWADPLPPPAAELRQKVVSCEGLVSLLTDKVDAALLDAAPRSKSSATMPWDSTMSMWPRPRSEVSLSGIRPGY